MGFSGPIRELFNMILSCLYLAAIFLFPALVIVLAVRDLRHTPGRTTHDRVVRTEADGKRTALTDPPRDI